MRPLSSHERTFFPETQISGRKTLREEPREMGQFKIRKDLSKGPIVEFMAVQEPTNLIPDDTAIAF
jgi:hypothetical protein